MTSVEDVKHAAEELAHETQETVDAGIHSLARGLGGVLKTASQVASETYEGIVYVLDEAQVRGQGRDVSSDTARAYVRAVVRRSSARASCRPQGYVTYASNVAKAAGDTAVNGVKGKVQRVGSKGAGRTHSSAWSAQGWKARCHCRCHSVHSQQPVHSLPSAGNHWGPTLARCAQGLRALPHQMVTAASRHNKHPVHSF